jgi:hypothetical protein
MFNLHFSSLSSGMNISLDRVTMGGRSTLIESLISIPFSAERSQESQSNLAVFRERFKWTITSLDLSNHRFLTLD